MGLKNDEKKNAGCVAGWRLTRVKVNENVPMICFFIFVLLSDLKMKDWREMCERLQKQWDAFSSWKKLLFIVLNKFFYLLDLILIGLSSTLLCITNGKFY